MDIPTELERAAAASPHEHQADRLRVAAVAYAAGDVRAALELAERSHVDALASQAYRYALDEGHILPIVQALRAELGITRT